MPQPLYAFGDGGATYLHLFGRYWRIENADALARVFGPDPQVERVDQLPGNPRFGPRISPASFLFHPGPGSGLYFMCGGNWTAYGITGTEARSHFQFNGRVVAGDGGPINDGLMRVVRRGASILVPGATEAMAAD